MISVFQSTSRGEYEYEYGIVHVILTRTRTLFGKFFVFRNSEISSDTRTCRQET